MTCYRALKISGSATERRRSGRREEVEERWWYWVKRRRGGGGLFEPFSLLALSMDDEVVAFSFSTEVTFEKKSIQTEGELKKKGNVIRPISVHFW